MNRSLGCKMQHSKSKVLKLEQPPRFDANAALNGQWSPIEAG